MLNLVTRPIGLDDLSDVRYLHGFSFRMCGADRHTPDEIENYLSRINSEEYIRECLNCSLYGLWHNHILIGTSGWTPAADNRSTARIRKVYIHGFYLGLGFGRMMVEAAEQRAQNAGFYEFSVRTNTNSTQFFTNLGYTIRSHGLLNTSNGPSVPVTFLRKKISKSVTPEPNHLSSSAIL